MAGSLSRAGGPGLQPSTLARGSGGAEPRDAQAEEAEPLLHDRRRYSSAEEIANDLERVYYVTVDNIVE